MPLWFHTRLPGRPACWRGQRRAHMDRADQHSHPKDTLNAVLVQAARKPVTPTPAVIEDSQRQRVRGVTASRGRRSLLNFLPRSVHPPPARSQWPSS
jgi:hypothetical protein